MGREEGWQAVTLLLTCLFGRTLMVKGAGFEEERLQVFVSPVWDLGFGY
jgi:hypothetical protein